MANDGKPCEAQVTNIPCLNIIQVLASEVKSQSTKQNYWFARYNYDQK